ncbi:MAG: ATP-binding protein [Bacteroidetes bacterium]|nr:ATP-binding protein [Bacteroidota bacterium]
MITPFIFGKLAFGSEFTNRSHELSRLNQNFQGGVNTIIISPRRWGKSSLVKKAAEEAGKKKSNLVFCFLDLYNTRSEEEFYRYLAQEVIKATSSKWEERLSFTRKFISRFIPSVTYSPEPNNEFSLSLNSKELMKSPDEILNLAENIAAAKKVHLILCIDEFQQIAEFKETKAFQKKLRAAFQTQRHVTYCLYGSKRTMMMHVFTAVSMPFYKFGDIIFLQKISENDWKKFLVDRFAQTGKKITEQQAVMISSMVENHPYYVQQLAQLSWLRSGKSCSNKIIVEAFESLTLQLSMLFQNLTDSLSPKQVNFLAALGDESQKFSSRDMLEKYKLGTSANVLKIKHALQQREIIDIDGGKIEFLDPVYKNWLNNYYFKRFSQ